jgi:undecaprenyl-diphosphatase
MVIPLILGKVTKDFLSGDMIMESQDAIPLAVGFMAAFVSGLLACTWMLTLVKNSKLYYFAAYCALVGMIAIAITLI